MLHVMCAGEDPETWSCGRKIYRPNVLFGAFEQVILVAYKLGATGVTLKYARLSGGIAVSISSDTRKCLDSIMFNLSLSQSRQTKHDETQ